MNEVILNHPLKTVFIQVIVDGIEIFSIRDRYNEAFKYYHQRIESINPKSEIETHINFY